MNCWRVRTHCSLFAVAVPFFFFAVPAWAQDDAASLYKAKCAVCHAADGSGNTPTGKKLGVRDFASPEVQSETDVQLIEITAKGKNKMPAYANSLKDVEVKELIVYIRDLAKKK
ncbi:MAG: cytochrome c [Candidatus Acidiferrum sp.]